MSDTVDLTHAVDGGHKYMRWLHEAGRKPVMVVLVPAPGPDELLADLVARLGDDDQDELYYGETAPTQPDGDAAMLIGPGGWRIKCRQAQAKNETLRIEVERLKNERTNLAELIRPLLPYEAAADGPNQAAARAAAAKHRTP